MSRIVTIKPKKGSKKFFTNAKKFNKVKGPDGREMDAEQGEYRGERFPNSRQMVRPKWSASKRRWLLHGFDQNGEELNKLVEGSKLKFEKGHPRVGEYITTADIWDYNDPFFGHKLLRITQREGEITLDKDRPLDQIILAGAKADPLYAEAGKGNSMLSSRVKYIITDSETALKMRKKEYGRKREAYKLLDAMDFKKKSKVAYIMSLVTSMEDLDPDLVDDALLRTIDDETGKIGKLSKLDYFIKISKETAENVAMKIMVINAKRKGILRKRKNGFELFGSFVGRTQEDVEEYLFASENQDVMLRLEGVLEEDQK